MWLSSTKENGSPPLQTSELGGSQTHEDKGVQTTYFSKFRKSYTPDSARIRTETKRRLSATSFPSSFINTEPKRNRRPVRYRTAEATFPAFGKPVLMTVNLPGASDEKNKKPESVDYKRNFDSPFMKRLGNNRSKFGGQNAESRKSLIANKVVDEGAAGPKEPGKDTEKSLARKSVTSGDGRPSRYHMSGPLVASKTDTRRKSTLAPKVVESNVKEEKPDTELRLGEPTYDDYEEDEYRDEEDTRVDVYIAFGLFIVAVYIVSRFRIRTY